MGNKPLNGVLHHVLDQMLINVGDMAQFSYSTILKDLKPKSILHIPLDFHLELSRLLGVDWWQYPYIISNG